MNPEARFRETVREVRDDLAYLQGLTTLSNVPNATQQKVHALIIKAQTTLSCAIRAYDAGHTGPLPT